VVSELSSLSKILGSPGTPEPPPLPENQVSPKSWRLSTISFDLLINLHRDGFPWSDLEGDDFQNKEQYQNGLEAEEDSLSVGDD
jgi:hypothetical protein